MTFEPCPGLKLNVVLMGRISVDQKKKKEKRKGKKRKKTSGRHYRNLLKSLSKLQGNYLITAEAEW